MNREEALHIFNHSEEIVSADAVNASISKMADAIRAEIGDAFPLVLSVMAAPRCYRDAAAASRFPAGIRLHPPDPLPQHDAGQPGDALARAPRESVKDRIVLVLDDILDEGETMAAIRDRIPTWAPSASCRP